ncbi:MAG: hypothetical protein IJ552_11235 [Prevotella sp.]|nr:hypothetical protein [Prevotella sp.]
MRKIYLIILGPNVKTEEVVARIQALGENYNFFTNQYLLQSQLDTSQEIYDYLIGGKGSEDQYIVIFNLEDHPKYWGFAKKELWSWLSEHKTNKESGL